MSATPSVPDLPPPDTRAFAIKEVIAREGQQIRALCAKRSVRDRLNPIIAPNQKRPSESHAPERFGVAFSGGGIRSAAVNLGLIQAMARSGFLRQAHYISGVSGGGYILGWLTAWIAHVGFDAVENQLSANSAWPNSQLPVRSGFRRYLEPNPIHYLRQYVSYLVPRSGLGSGDTLVAIAIYLRNVLLIQTMLASALIAIFALLQMAAPALMWTHLRDGFGHTQFHIFAQVLLVALALPIWTALGLLARNADPVTRRYWSAAARICGVALCVVIWLTLPAYIRTHPSASPFAIAGLWKPAAWITGFFLLEFVVTLFQNLAFGGEEMLKGVEPQDVWWVRPLAAIGAGIFGATLIAGFRLWLLHTPGTVVSTSYVVLGLPALLLATSLVSFAQVGLFGDAFPDAKREWLARLAGYFLFFGIIAGVVLSVTILGPYCIHWVLSRAPGWKGTIIKWILPGGWIATTVSGLFAARSSNTGKKSDGGNSVAMEALASIAPPVFLLGLMILLSAGTHFLAIRLGSGEYLRFDHIAVAPVHSFRALALLAGISGIIGVLLGWRVSVNEFSLNLFYRNRLVRTFLGASNINARTGRSMRRPDPFTGFTLDDDHYLGSLRQGKFDGPYPMWCAALNLTGGEDLAWQKRKASSFLFSPLFCGWDYMPSHASAIKGNAYREVAACTEEGVSNGEGYGGKGGAPLIGTAMAASGAAVSPNWGFHTKPAIAALLAVFNVRIGLWAGNPLDPNGYKKYAPGIGYFLHELLGSANEKKEYVYLSDGGNFENLGLYELIRRRVKYIIVSDADADPTYEFGDFANAIEKCRVDFGVQIDMGDYSTMVPRKKTALSTTHFAVGKIRYLPQSLADQTYPDYGVLLYIKSSITGDEPAQVLGQRSAGSKFPHDETLNQFFNETQFEAYRALGDHMGKSIMEDLYSTYLTANGKDFPAPRDLSAEQRADFVRTFFDSFLTAAWEGKASLSLSGNSNAVAP